MKRTTIESAIDRACQARVSAALKRAKERRIRQLIAAQARGLAAPAREQVDLMQISLYDLPAMLTQHEE